MLQAIAMIFGAIIFVVGLLGFYPPAMEGSNLLGIFAVNPFHNIIHILTGVVAFGCGYKSEELSRVFFRIFGIVYGIVTLLGLFYMDQPILGLIANNMADVILHLVISAVSIYLGFFYKSEANRYP